jgi:hypothetical protein
LHHEGECCGILGTSCDSPHQDFAVRPITTKKPIEMIIISIGMPPSCQIYIVYKLGILRVSKVIVGRIIPDIKLKKKSCWIENI